MYKFAWILCLAVAALGQTATSQWDKVQGIAPGTGVRIAAEAAAPIRGEFESATESALILRLPSSPQSYGRPQIVTVSVKKKGHRLRNSLIWLGVGLAIGVGIGAAAASHCNGLLCEYNVPVFAGLGIIGGTVTGVVWPTGGWREVYRR